MYKQPTLDCRNTRNVQTRTPVYPHLGRDVWSVRGPGNEMEHLLGEQSRTFCVCV